MSKDLATAFAVTAKDLNGSYIGRRCEFDHDGVKVMGTLSHAKLGTAERAFLVLADASTREFAVDFSAEITFYGKDKGGEPGTGRMVGA